MNLKLTGPKYNCLVPWYRVGSPISIDTKVMKIGQRMTSQWRFQTWPDSKSGSSMKKENREMVFLTCPESFSTIPCRYFSKWRLKIFWGGNHPPTFDGSPYPHLRGTPLFFHQHDRKGCKKDVLDARGHFLLRFCAAGDKPSGGW